ncbi:ESX secretion-associated protein EspG [Mycolicibacterium senegalense]|uniref:ESX secretion-associated protein EspG n=1 Tax=Mycobacteriaceae TaxID=1762 RepID=UPI003AAC06D3
MTASLQKPFLLTDNELMAAAARVGVHSFPTVLAVRPRQSTLDRVSQALGDATQALSARELIIDGVVDADLVAILAALQRPDRELAMRMVTPEGMARICVVRRGEMCVLARRIGHEITLKIVGHSTELRDAAAALLTELPSANAADVTPVGAPLAEVTEYLSGTHDPGILADRIRALGAEPRAAMLLGSALASRQAFAEIVYYELDRHEDRIMRTPAAVGIFYTRRGRIVGAPSASPAGQLWTTLKAGSDHAIGQAVAQLVELADEGWGDL